MRLRNELYPVGFFGLLFINTLFNQWIVFSHAPPGAQGAAGRLDGGVGTLLLLGYLLQAVANPLVGFAGDRLRARFGSRRPLVLLGAPPLLFVFALLWRPASSPLLVLVYCLLFAVVVQPWVSLLPSIANTEPIRLRMTLTGSFSALAAAGAALVTGPLLVEHSGFNALALVGVVVFVLTLVVPALLVREAEDGAAATRPATGLWTQLGEVLRRPTVLRFVIGATLLAWTMMSLVVCAPYVAAAVLHRSQATTAVLNGFLVVGMLVSVGLLGWLGKRHTPLTLMKAGSLLGVAVLLVLGGVTFSPPGEVTFAVCAAGFFALGYLALTVLALPSLVAAKLSDEDGQGREGLYFGLGGVAAGVGNALGAFSASTLLGLARDAADPTGLQATVALAGVVTAVAAAVLPRGSRPR